MIEVERLRAIAAAVEPVCEMWESVRIVDPSEREPGVRRAWPGFAEALDDLLATLPADAAKGSAP